MQTHPGSDQILIGGLTVEVISMLMLYLIILSLSLCLELFNIWPGY